MKLVQKGNKQLRVADDRLEDMLKSGYVEVDMKTGKPAALPAKEDGSSALKKENAALKKENTALKKENKLLKTQVEELTAKLEAAAQPPAE